jgi:hypothetical protein
MILDISSTRSTGAARTSPEGVGWMLMVGLGLLLATGVGARAQQDAKPTKPPTRTSARSQPAQPAKMVLETRAIDLLKAASARLAAAKSMAFTAVVSYEYPSQLGPPIQYTVRYDVAMRRPDKLRVLIPGDGPASEFYYDGKSMMAYAPAENLVAVADAPPTIDGALKAAFENADIYYPFTDMIVDDPYAALSDGAILAFYIGPSSVVGGTKTVMMAWANPNVFLQIWIGADDKLPRRIRAVYSADPLALRHEMDLTNWQIDPDIPADTFASPKARNAPRIAFDRPLVARPPPGLKALGNAKSSTAAPAQAPPKPDAKSP